VQKPARPHRPARSGTVRRMDEPRGPDGRPEPSIEGRLTAGQARALLERADELLGSGEFGEAARHYARVIGFDDPAITAAALLGLGEARYRMDDEAGGIVDWDAVLRLPENPSTYAAWRNLAAAHVRAGDLHRAIDAYRQAERRAPAEDKAEIATRLGWLAKETGDQRAAGRYFARGRGDGPLLPMWRLILIVTVVISLTAEFSTEGQTLFRLLALDKAALANGEYWRLWSVTLLHGGILHLAFNMYALYLAGPIVERWYGSIRFVVFYLTCAAAGSIGSFVFGGDAPSVGASGAIFGLFGLLLAAGRLHHPVDRESRAIVGQLGTVILINLVFGFVSGGSIDNAAHIGGLLAGFWLGAVIPPTRVSTLGSFWQRPGPDGRLAGPARPPALVPVLAVLAVAGVVAAGLAVGTAARQDGRVGDGAEVPRMGIVCTAAPSWSGPQLEALEATNVLPRAA
jgi:membrane associated rhomboid family serine protease